MTTDDVLGVYAGRIHATALFLPFQGDIIARLRSKLRNYNVRNHEIIAPERLKIRIFFHIYLRNPNKSSNFAR